MNKLIAVAALFVVATAESCDVRNPAPPTSVSGVRQAAAGVVRTGSDGLTAEQRNIRQRIVEDNKPGAIKHLYVISAYSGQVLLYSTVRGKVTSGGKRLTPETVFAGRSDSYSGIPIVVSGETQRTGEVIQDDGAYGSSMNYLYWWDERGVYHQHYVEGGQIVHISSEPLNVPKVIINLSGPKAPTP